LSRLKVVVVGEQFPDSFARSISDNLRAMGHDVTNLSVARAHRFHGRFRQAFWTYVPKAFPSIERTAFRDLIRVAKAIQPDLTLTYWYTPPEVVLELKETCSDKVACWYVDALTNLDRMYLIASPLDAVFLKEPFLVRSLRDKLGIEAHYLPECCNPLAYGRVALSDEDRRSYGCDLTAMGTLHYYRARMLEVFDGYDLRIWGNNCPQWLVSPVRKYYTNQYVTEGEKAKALLAAKIVINTINLAEIEGVNGALFQTAGCGAFQIADWKPSLPELFEPEREIVTFRTRQELKEKVDYYLAHPEQRREIADRAYVRARREHTYERRLRKMLEILGFPSAADSPKHQLTPIGAERSSCLDC